MDQNRARMKRVILALDIEGESFQMLYDLEIFKRMNPLGDAGIRETPD